MEPSGDDKKVGRDSSISYGPEYYANRTFLKLCVCVFGAGWGISIDTISLEGMANRYKQSMGSAEAENFVPGSSLCYQP